ncbi:hypothetical protein, conserved [Eimeria praecox]|uniref:Uncharacterized protein n=1 Tax=Eimeria praecox TaxID=51316 RepID=U6GQ06_9EIME|nr:hypothetical protein, conserved [Eimeria praecox]
MSRQAAVSYGFLLLSISSLADASSSATRKLQRQHALFGKCTAEDLLSGTDTSSFSFLQEETASPASEEECMELLLQQDSLFASALADSTAEDEEGSERITDSYTSEEAVALAKELLQKGRSDDAVDELKSLKRSIALFGNAAKDSTIVVLGLGVHVHSLAKMAKNVIAVEADYKLCREFLSSKGGGCAMQPNVHIYCPKLASSNLKEESEASETQKHFEIAEDLIDDLMKQQFGDVPASALAVLGSFAVAKLALMERFLDQSSVILARSRMSCEGLKAISGSFRVLASFEPDHHSSSHSTETLMLLQRLFTPPVQGDKWKEYATQEWELPDNMAPLTLWCTVREAIKPIAADESVSLWKRKALDTYLDVYAHAAITGSDEDWKDVTSALEATLDVVGKAEKAESVLKQESEFAFHLAWKVASMSGLQEYFELLLDTLSNVRSEDKPFIHAVICDLIAKTGRLVASQNILDKVKDAIEEACELAEKDPKLFLPALRLIYGGMTREEGMAECLRILVKLKEGVSAVDASAILEEAGK